jgi:hypothetical protein
MQLLFRGVQVIKGLVKDTEQCYHDIDRTDNFQGRIESMN